MVIVNNKKLVRRGHGNMHTHYIVLRNHCQIINEIRLSAQWVNVLITDAQIGSNEWTK